MEKIKIIQMTEEEEKRFYNWFHNLRLLNDDYSISSIENFSKMAWNEANNIKETEKTTKTNENEAGCVCKDCGGVMMSTIKKFCNCGFKD